MTTPDSSDTGHIYPFQVRWETALRAIQVTAGELKPGESMHIVRNCDDDANVFTISVLGAAPLAPTLAFPIKLDDAYPCRGKDANGKTVVYDALLQEGETVGLYSTPDGEAIPPHGTVIRRDDGLWIEANE